MLTIDREDNSKLFVQETMLARVSTVWRLPDVGESMFFRALANFFLNAFPMISAGSVDIAFGIRDLALRGVPPGDLTL